MDHFRWLAIAALAAGCSGNTVSGTVGGEKVKGAKSAVFDNVEYDIFGIEFDFIIVMLSDIPDLCGFLDAVDEAEGDCAEACATYVDAVDTYAKPEETWFTTLLFNVGGGSEVAEYTYDESLDGDGEFSGTYSFLDLSEAKDAATCEAACEGDDDDDDDDSDDEEASTGTAEISKYEAGEVAKGDFELEFGGDDSLKGKFDADPCNLDMAF